MNSNRSSGQESVSSREELQQRLRQVRAEEAALQAQIQLQNYAATYPIQLAWPAHVTSSSTGKRTRTNVDLIQHRLIEAGILYGIPVDTADAVAAANAFIRNLQATDCFHSVSVQLGSSTSDEQPQQQTEDDMLNERQVHVQLHEKNWYRLHAGAGLKHDWSKSMHLDSSSSSDANSFFPTAEVEVSAGLRNLAGVLDRTDLQYGLDTHNIVTWNLTHTRPLYSIFPTDSTVSDFFLQQANGSQYHFQARAALDTVDHQHTSSYKQFQRLLSCKAATTSDNIISSQQQVLQQPWFGSLEWAAVWRDVVPRRHATLPYHCAASSAVLAQAGPSVKHSVTAVLHYDSCHSTTTTTTAAEAFPQQGWQVQCETELAGPPGDVGFVKSQLRAAVHSTITNNDDDNNNTTAAAAVTLHGLVAVGGLRALSFGGLCGCDNATTTTKTHIADRFLLGGTNSFRGFVPGGVGPRCSASTNNNASSNKSGDALGGNFFYTATALASVAPPPPTTDGLLAALVQHVRLFGFLTAGTCVNTTKTTSLIDVGKSSRVSAGVGIATKALGPRIEATYAWPLRFGPNDQRRRFQFGVSFSIG